MFAGRFFDTGFGSLWHRPLRRNPFIANAALSRKQQQPK
jgi:hypothetical protein